ncbi:hypothetical protein PV327_005258 [Microctonus hyperodae]|uniref:BING4 C-terminal domain-containing protein n=1 Tax=Microctonus hyperodae TaxID=165561 RepID=A0AA39KZD2_MICHY|nr:hypothetical protein PV327_005258 [Microctonus hyperodae]
MKKADKTNPYPGKAPIAKEKVEKYKNGDDLDLNVKNKNIRNHVHRDRLRIKERAIKKAAEQAARAEILLTEDHGYLISDIGETTTQFNQSAITSQVDITSASKHFELDLEFGPYRLKYTRNGRHLLLGGRKGHVAAIDWVTKRLECELNVMESVHDISWLHFETMYAVAQKKWVYIYDNRGIELHCLKRLYNVTRLEFLPYHFLLATASSEGYLAWLDVSIGQIISRYNSKLGNISVMTQNPANAVLCVGNSKGVVSMWSPMVQEPLAKMLCHKQSISSLAVHPYGTYMATTSPDRSLKVWDIRKLSGPVHDVILPTATHNIAYSQRGLLAVSRGNDVQIYRESFDTLQPYMREKFTWAIGNMQFCPYEDVLGVGTTKGFTSLIIPGAGEPNFDALEVNPFQTSSQRREAEVKALLDKIQPELITLDPDAVAQVHVPSVKEKIEAREKLRFIKPRSVDLKSRKKDKNLSSIKILKSKRIMKEIEKREVIRNSAVITERKVPKNKIIQKKNYNVALNRFVSKTN